MFFSGSRAHFFRPLNGKYREVVSACLAGLYRRQFTSLADYGQSLSRQQVIDTFADTIARSGAQFEDETELLASDPRKLALWIFNQLRENAWLDERADAVSMTASYGLSVVGRNFAQAFVADNPLQVRTHHRNTRNTRNALKAFVVGHDVHDLLDACEYSERIIADFSDIIVELEQRRNQLVDQVKNEGEADVAADSFFDFLERRFEPDLAVRLSADSVERYRDEILQLLRKFRETKKVTRLQVERDLRALKLEGFSEHEIWYEQLLRMIEQRLRNACDVMLPAVRDALTSFTQRADAIIRQLTSLSSGAVQSSSDALAQLGRVPNAKRERILSQLAEEMGTVEIGFIDPGQVKPLKRRATDALVQTAEAKIEVSDEGQRLIQISALLDKAFAMSHQQFVEALQNIVGDEVSTTADWKIDKPLDLMMLANIVAAGAASGSGDSDFEVASTGETEHDEYFDSRDKFTIKRRVS
ncbi:Wadjet anti-phage system protein JetA family protein [uncultured Umboniibacter sp.]|uniref:Wadjet anti-phage system protein JetA family protein n=1 Tax=uncultured Umboniibacter sp. TaxID=1798917 RepID=UPI002639A0CF|nr:Wadjet anti-phage system protein JetA family protein [uncultured Umboniibacter sp.]